MTSRSRSEVKKQLHEMDPYEFEQLVAALFDSEGYDTTVRNYSGDKGVDVEAKKEYPFELSLLIQAKQYSKGNKVGSQEIRSYATLHKQEPDTDVVIIATTSTLTKEAKELAEDLNVKTMDRNRIIKLIASNDPNIEQEITSTGIDETPSDAGIEPKIAQGVRSLLKRSLPAKLEIEWGARRNFRRDITVYRTNNNKIRFNLPSNMSIEDAKNVSGLFNIRQHSGLTCETNAENEDELVHIIIELINKIPKKDKEKLEVELG